MILSHSLNIARAFKVLDPVVQSLDNSIQWINRCPVDKITPFVVMIG